MSAAADTRALFEAQAEELRDELVAALTEVRVSEGIFGGATRAQARCVETLPALDEPEALDEWSYTLGRKGLLAEIEQRIERGAGVVRMRLWLRAYDVCAELVELLALAEGQAAKAAA